jgi:SPP1 family predicted phage head-tail adaptor
MTPTTSYVADNLTRRVTFQQLVTTPDGMGGTKINWVDLITVWAAVDNVPMLDEVWRAGQMVTGDMIQIGVRYSPALMDSRMRIVYMNRTYRYWSAVNVDQARFFIAITAQAEPNAT